MIVNVVRLPGDKAAPEPLVDEVMTAAHVATVKGRCYIDRMGTSKEDVHHFRAASGGSGDGGAGRHL